LPINDNHNGNLLTTKASISFRYSCSKFTSYNTKINKYLELSVAMRNLWCLEKKSILPLVISATGIVPQSLFKNLKILDLDNTLVVEIQNSILSIKNGNDNVRMEDNCLEEELATTPILSEIRTLSLTFVMLMRFFARLNIYYKTFLTRMQCDTTPFTSCCHNVDFCIAFLRQSANNYRHCSFCAQISPVVLKNKQ
jgi:hypothetical protein